MNTGKPHTVIAQPALRKYRSYGLSGGVALGLVVGVLLSGPHFDEWPAVASLAVVLASAAVGALIGWLLLAIAAGSVAGGGVWGEARAQGRDVSGVEDCSGGNDGGNAC